MSATAHINPVLASSVRALWKITLFPIAATLILLEPVVGFVCGAMMFGGVFAAVVFEVSAVGPHFPFLLMLGFSLSFGVIYLAYQFVLTSLVMD